MDNRGKLLNKHDFRIIASLETTYSISTYCEKGIDFSSKCANKIRFNPSKNVLNLI